MAFKIQRGMSLFCIYSEFLCMKSYADIIIIGKDLVDENGKEKDTGDSLMFYGLMAQWSAVNCPVNVFKFESISIISGLLWC